MSAFKASLAFLLTLLPQAGHGINFSSTSSVVSGNMSFKRLNCFTI